MVSVALATLVMLAGCGVSDICDVTASDVEGSFRVEIFNVKRCDCGSTAGEPGDCTTKCATVIANNDARCDEAGTYCEYYRREGGSLRFAVDADGNVSAGRILADGTIDTKDEYLNCHANDGANGCDLELSCTNDGHPVTVTWKRVEE